MATPSSESPSRNRILVSSDSPTRGSWVSAKQKQKTLRIFAKKDIEHIENHGKHLKKNGYNWKQVKTYCGRVLKIICGKTSPLRHIHIACRAWKGLLRIFWYGSLRFWSDVKRHALPKREKRLQKAPRHSAPVSRSSLSEKSSPRHFSRNCLRVETHGSRWVDLDPFGSTFQATESQSPRSVWKFFVISPHITVGQEVGPRETVSQSRILPTSLTINGLFPLFGLCALESLQE